jgi:hypothetical protein
VVGEVGIRWRGDLQLVDELEEQPLAADAALPPRHFQGRCAGYGIDARLAAVGVIVHPLVVGARVAGLTHERAGVAGAGDACTDALAVATVVVAARRAVAARGAGAIGVGAGVLLGRGGVAAAVHALAAGTGGVVVAARGEEEHHFERGEEQNALPQLEGLHFGLLIFGSRQAIPPLAIPV